MKNNHTDTSEKTRVVDSTPEQGQSKDSSAAMYDGGWSWGAFMFDVPFIIAVGNYRYLLFFLLLFVPVVDAYFWVIYLLYKVYLGTVGRDMAVGSSTFASAGERAGFFKGLDWAGKVLFYTLLLFVGLGILFGLLVGVGVISPEILTPTQPAGFPATMSL